MASHTRPRDAPRASGYKPRPRNGDPHAPPPPSSSLSSSSAGAAESPAARAHAASSSPSPASPQLLQSVYDTYAENIHAISVRASSQSALSGYGATASAGGFSTAGGAAAARRRRSTSVSSSSAADDGDVADAAAVDWRLSPLQTSFHLISFMAGPGLVFLPLALVDLDWYGVLGLVVAAAMCAYTSRLLIEAVDLLRWSSGRHVTYCDLAQACLGTRGFYLTAALLHGSFLVSATGYVSLVTSCVTGITGLSYGLALACVGVAVWTHVLVPSLQALALLSAVNVGVCFWVEAVIFGDAMYPLKQIALDESAFFFGTPDLSAASLPLKLAYAFALLASGFFCHAVIPTFYNAMADHRACGAVVARSQAAVLLLLYLPICVVTYAVYGATLQAPVFFNMRSPVVRTLAIVLYCVHLLLSYAVTLAPLQRALERTLRIASPELRPLLAPRSPAPARLYGLLHASETHPLQKSLDPYDDEGEDEAIPAGRAHGRGLGVTARQRLVRSATVLASVALAYVFRPTTLGILGVTVVPATTLALVLPCVFFWTLCTEEAGCLDKLAIVAIVAVAAASMTASVYAIVVLG